MLVVLDREDTNAALSFRNLPDVQIIHTGELNAYDVLCNDYIVFTKASLEVGAATGRRVAGASNAEPTDATESPSVSAGTAASVEAETGVASASEQPDASESYRASASNRRGKRQRRGGPSESSSEEE